MTDVWVDCNACYGRGERQTTEDPAGPWERCDACDGTGGFWAYYDDPEPEEDKSVASWWGQFPDQKEEKD